ncbi:hypothetical protein ZTR_03539 [Talaromyces verruculosus]|nr:hypothetical protein ZTR_03539 [Talaromyces verruculosus]
MAGHFLSRLGSRAANGWGSLYKEWPQIDTHFSSQPPWEGGFHRPSRFEGEINNLEVYGEIPHEIDGTFYRVMPEPQFPAFADKNVWFNGDGNISAFRISNGHVDFKQRYVRTEKFVREGEARRALMGKYRNRYTDLVHFEVRSTANTNIVYWDGKLLALKEDSPPYAMDPNTLETLGLYDFGGQLPALTFTAHPKFDPATHEMICFGYEAKGDATNDVCYYTFDKQGRLVEEVWVDAPVCGMIHDFGVTENYVLFPIIPLLCDLDRLKAGGNHWQWENDIPMYIGVLPRRGAKGTDVKWFRAPHGFPGHTANAYEDADGIINFHTTYCKVNAFFWWPDKNGVAPKPDELEPRLYNFKIDYHSKNLDLGEPETLLSTDNCEFPRIDDRIALARHSWVFINVLDVDAGTDLPFVATRMGGSPPFNTIAAFNVKTKEYKKYFTGPRKTTQECVFVPRNADAPEGDGFVIALLNNYEDMVSELVILDTRDFSKEVALVRLPFTLRAGLHGNWVDSSDADGHPGTLKAL